MCVCVCSSRVHLCFARLTHEVMIKKWLKGEDNLLKQHGCHLVRHTWTLADVFKSGSNLKKKKKNSESARNNSGFVSRVELMPNNFIETVRLFLKSRNCKMSKSGNVAKYALCS